MNIVEAGIVIAIIVMFFSAALLIGKAANATELTARPRRSDTE